LQEHHYPGHKMKGLMGAIIGYFVDDDARIVW
jgi:hypothetical protein